MQRRDPWTCSDCGRRADLAAATVEVGLLRLALNGADGFQLGSQGIEPEVASLLEPCECGGRFQPGEGAGPPATVVVDRDALAPMAAAGWETLQATPQLSDLVEVWRPRAALLTGAGDDLAKEDVLRLRLEDKLAALQAELERARAAGDEDAAETAHARYIELGTTYVRRFVRSDEPRPS